MHEIHNVRDYLIDVLSDDAFTKHVSARYFDLHVAQDYEFIELLKQRKQTVDDVKDGMVDAIAGDIEKWRDSIKGIIPKCDDTERALIIVSNRFDCDIVPIDGIVVGSDAVASDDVAAFKKLVRSVSVPFESFDVSCLKYSEMSRIPSMLARRTYMTSIDDLHARNDKVDFDGECWAYAFEMQPIEEIMAYDVLVPHMYSEDERAVFVSELISEITFFGFDIDDGENEKQENVDKLEESIKAIDELKDSSELDAIDGDGYQAFKPSAVGIDEMYDRLGIEPPSALMRAMNHRIDDAVMVMSMNHRLDIYRDAYEAVMDDDVRREWVNG